MRRGRRRTAHGKLKGDDQLPFKQPSYSWPLTTLVTQDIIENIHDASMQILERTGIRFLDDEALDLWRKAGAKVDASRQLVKLDRDLIAECLKTAPSSFTWRARNPEKTLIVGDNHIIFAANGGMVNISSADTPRRPGTDEDLKKIVKLIHTTQTVHTCSPQGVALHDVPMPFRHLHGFSHNIFLTDKALVSDSNGRIISADCIDMARIVFGGDITTGGPVTGGIINVNSPLVFDERMLGGLITHARAGQFVVVTPFILAGAMSPLTLPAAIAQQNAEALAGIALSQLVRRGAPAVYGGFTSPLDLRSGGPAFGTPEGAWALQIGAQLARHYKLPYRGSGSLNTSNSPDLQASYESLWSLWPNIMSGSNLIVHSIGWLEGGLTVNFEKFIVDAENLSMMQYYLQGIDWSNADFALEAIHEVGPGGHHLGTTHTQERYRTAFYESKLADRQPFEAWLEAGSKTTLERATEIWKARLRDYEEPGLEDSKREALLDFLARRKEELKGVDLYS